MLMFMRTMPVTTRVPGLGVLSRFSVRFHTSKLPAFSPIRNRLQLPLPSPQSS